MSSVLSGPQRRKLLNTMLTPVSTSRWGDQSGLTNTAKISRSDEIVAGTRPNDKAANLISEAEYADPARQAALAAQRIVARDAWNDLISDQAGRRIELKAAGWQRTYDNQRGHA